MKTPVLVTLIIVGGMLIAAPVTYSFVLRCRGNANALPPEEIFPCIYGGFAIVVGAILLAFFSRWFREGGGGGGLGKAKRITTPSKTSSAPAEAGDNPPGMPGMPL